MKNAVKTLKRLELMSGVGSIAISTSTFASPSGQAKVAIELDWLGSKVEVASWCLLGVAADEECAVPTHVPPRAAPGCLSHNGGTRPRYQRHGSVPSKQRELAR